MRTIWILFIFVVTCTFSAPAKAQLDEKKSLIFVSGLYDAQTTSLSGERTLDIYVEAGAFNSTWDKEQSVSVAAGFMRDIASGFSIGVAYQSVNTTATETFTAQVPHPLYFDLPRPLDGSAADLSYKEQAIHFPIGFMKTSGRIVFSVAGGPSYFLTKTEMVSDLVLADTYPYTSVTLTSVEKQTYDANTIGFNVGGLVGVRLHDNFALGAQVLFSRGKAKFTNESGSELELDAGGLWVGVGIQILF